MQRKLKQRKHGSSTASPEKPQADTMNALSELTGFSRVTISKVLNGRKGVKEETRQKILQAIELYDFHPNIAARNLVMKKSNRIGIVLTGQDGWTFSTVNSWYFHEVLRGILYRAEQVGMNVILYTKKPDIDLSKLVRSREVDAIIMVGTATLPEQVKPLAAKNIPYAVILNIPEGYETNGIDYDNYNGACEAINHLLALGHRDIAVVKSYVSSEGEFTVQRFNGVVDMLSRVGLKPWTGIESPLDIGQIRDVLSAAKRPTALFCIDYVPDMIAIIRECGLSVPKDLALVGFDDHPAYTVAHPPLTVVRQPLFEIGVLAISKVFDLLISEQSSFPNVILPMELVIRESTICSTKISDRFEGQQALLGNDEFRA